MIISGLMLLGFVISSAYYTDNVLFRWIIIGGLAFTVVFIEAIKDFKKDMKIALLKNDKAEAESKRQAMDGAVLIQGMWFWSLVVVAIVTFSCFPGSW